MVRRVRSTPTAKLGVSSGAAPFRTRPLRLLTIAALALVGAVLVIYGQTWDHGFVNWDDGKYIVDNPEVKAGLTARGTVWAFTTSHASNWHPLTWLSHMLDCELFGLNAGGHHLTSALLHGANAVLLLLALLAMKRAFWPSLLVAAFFAVHPLRVESVAWAAERKDVLAGTFWMLTMLAYAGYAARPGALRYLVVTACIALGLMAKPMLVTIPLVLLLLDIWPLDRWVWGTRPTRRLLVEKMPWIAMAAASGVVTMLAQQGGGAVSSLEQIRPGLRVANAVISYAAYLWKTLWPAKLAFFYPHPALVSLGEPSIPVAATAGAALLISGVTWLVVRRGSDRPYLPVGWLWYLVTLVPVIGLFQVGRQALADRYTYIPLIGVYIGIVWLLHDSVRRPAARRMLSVVSVVAIASLAVVAWVQVGHWRDSRSLFRHALEVTENNYIAHNNLGNILREEGQLDLAAGHYEQVIRIRPDHAAAHNNLGMVHSAGGDLDRAEALYRRAIRLDPGLAEAHGNLGNVYRRRGDLERAEASYRRAVEADPEYATAHVHLGNLLARRGELAAAADRYRRAIELAPDDLDANYNLGAVLEASGQTGPAADQFERTLRIDPDHAEARRRLNRLQPRNGNR